MKHPLLLRLHFSERMNDTVGDVRLILAKNGIQTAAK